MDGARAEAIAQDLVSAGQRQVELHGERLAAERREYERAELKRQFTYHAPTDVERRKYARINEALYFAALTILEECPASADRTDAIRSIRNARMTANAAIANAQAEAEGK